MRSVFMIHSWAYSSVTKGWARLFVSFDTPVGETQIMDFSGIAFFLTHGRTLTPTFPHPEKKGGLTFLSRRCNKERYRLPFDRQVYISGTVAMATLDDNVRSWYA